MPGSTLESAVRATAARLAAAGIDTARLDARILAGHVVGIGAAEVVVQGDARLSPGQQSALERLAERRLRHEPVARILGRREFWGLDFDVTPDVLDPRPDTETVVDAALGLMRLGPGHDGRILDLGTGSGCILIALLSELAAASGIGTDISAAALAVAATNARRLHVADRAGFVVTSWADGVGGPFDLVVSNPPYLSAADMAARAPEVVFDPALALDGGGDGLAAYRALLPGAWRVLAPGGALVLEIGATQARGVSAVAAEAGFTTLDVRADLAGRPRVVTGRKPA